MKNVAPITDSIDVINRRYVDDKTADIYTSVTDDFTDSTKIGTNNGVVVDTANSLVRPAISAYTDDFSTQNFMDEDNTSSFVDIIGGTAYVSTTSKPEGFPQNFTGYDGTTNSSNVQVYRSKNYNFADAVTKFRLTADFTTPTGLTGFTSVSGRKIINNSFDYEINSSSTGSPEAFIASNDVTISGVKQTWVSQYYTPNTSDLQIVTPTTTIPIATTLSYTPSLSDTLNRNSVIEEDVNFVYFAYPTSASAYTIIRINKTTLSIDGSSVVVNGTTMQKIDIKAQDNRLHILWTDSGTRTVNYNFINTNSWGSLAGTSQALVTNTTTTDIMYSCQLVPADGSKMGWVSFTRKSTNCIHFGIIDTVSNTAPYQFKTAPVATATNLVGCMTISNSGNGSGCMVFDPVNNLFYIMAARNADNGLTFVIINNGQTTTTTIANGSNTTAPLNSFSKRNMVAILENQTNVHMFWMNATRNELEYTKLSFASNTMTNLNSAGVIIHSEVSNEHMISSICQIGSSPFQFQVNTAYVSAGSSLSQYRNFSFKTNIQPILQASVNTSVQTKIETGVPLEFSMSATNNAYVAFRFIYPINRLGQTSAISFSSIPLSVTLNGYTLEQVTPTPSGSTTTSSFTSTALVTDRIVKSVTLDVTQNVGIAGNDISWQVASLGDNWIDVGSGTTTTAVGTSNNWNVTFNENYYGSQLRVKATLTKAAGATTIADVPTIQKYVANVKNVVTVSDIYPMQINLMKLALQVNTITTANRLGYKNMMIDTFQSDAGVEPYSSLFTWFSNGSFSNTSGSQQILTSVAEDADITNVTSIVVIGDQSDIAQGVTYQVRRGDGDTWVTVTPEQVYTFQTGTPTNKVQIRAIVPNLPGVVRGWAYLYA